jgi:hypothetical protein
MWAAVQCMAIGLGIDPDLVGSRAEIAKLQ